jgi:general secretion pathway protein L
VLAEFLEWWFARLRELAPSGLAARDAWADAAVMDASDGTSITLWRRRGDASPLASVAAGGDTGQLRDAASALPARSPVVVLLPKERILRRPVTLPLAAERDLGRVLGYELERLTPFEANEIYWGHDVRERDVARKRIVLDMHVAPRAPLRPLLDLLGPQASRRVRLEAAGTDGVRSIDLGVECDGARAPVQRAVVLATWVLAAAVVALPMVRQGLDLSAARARLVLVAPRMDEVQKLRKEIVGAGNDVLASEARRVGDALRTLAAVTDDLPDDSHLTELTLRERKLTMTGTSAAAPRLIDALSSDKRLRNPAFAAPVTRNETVHLDVFSITAEAAR